MSRFFWNPNDSESESSEEEVQEPIQSSAYFYTSDDENVKRIAKPAKEKFCDEIKGIILLLKNYRKIKDYSSLLSAFDDLLKCYGKAQNILTEDRRPPQFLIRCLWDLQQFVSNTWDDIELRKNLTKVGYKSLASLRQKLRRFCKTFENDLTAFAAKNPENYDENDLEDMQFGEETKEISSVDERSCSESDSEGDAQFDNKRDCFMKKAGNVEDGFKKKGRKKNEKKLSSENNDGNDSDWETVKGGMSSGLDGQKILLNLSEVTVETVKAKLKQVLLSGTLKRSDRRQRIEILQQLIATCIEHELSWPIIIKLQLAKISALFDYNMSALDPMKSEYWGMLLICLQDLTSTLLTGEHTEEVTISYDFDDDEEEFENIPYKIKAGLAAVVERLIDEFVKMLKKIDHFQNIYAESLRDEILILDIVDKVLIFLEAHGDPTELCRVKLCKIELIYYKFDHQDGSSLEMMDSLCKFVYLNDKTQRLRTRAILAHIYHHALHDRWTKARDLMLMSHLQSNIHHADPSTQILYNRAMAQLGMCAFRNGLLSDAHNCLGDLIASGRLREMLGQGFTTIRNVERTPEQEQRDRQYQIPFHMSINLEVLECFYLVSAMLVNVPVIASQEHDARRRPISKSFYLLLRASERLSLMGPPETMKEHIVAASRALRAAKWRECMDFLFNPKMKAKIWCMVQQKTPFKELLVKVLKKEALKCYLFTFAAPVYDSLQLSKLAGMFDMTDVEVQTVLASMIVEGELDAALDLPSQTLILRSAGRSTLQTLTCQLAEKLGSLIDVTERFSDRSLRPNALQQGRQRRTILA